MPSGGYHRGIIRYIPLVGIYPNVKGLVWNTLVPLVFGYCGKKNFPVMKEFLHIITKSIILTVVGIVVYLLYMYLFHW